MEDVLPFTLLFFDGLKVECCGIDAVALASCCAWTIIEYVAQVSATVFTVHLGAYHKKRAILV